MAHAYQPEGSMFSHSDRTVKSPLEGSRSRPTHLERDENLARVAPFLGLWLIAFVAVEWHFEIYLSSYFWIVWSVSYLAVFSIRVFVVWLLLYRAEVASLRLWRRALFTSLGLLNIVHGAFWGLFAWLVIPMVPLYEQMLLSWMLVLAGAVAAVTMPTRTLHLRLYLLMTLVPTSAAWSFLGGTANQSVAASLILLAVIYDRLGVRQADDASDRKLHAQKLTQANELLEKSNVSKTRLIVEASHDLRQPVHAMGMMLDRLDPHGPREELGRRLHEIQFCMNTVSDMLIDLLDLSKLETGEYVVDLQAVDIGALLKGLDKTYGPMAQRKGLQWVVSECSVCVLSDPAMLKRILNNLISNAIKYTASGSVGMTCRVSTAGVQLRISDTGSGIPSQQLDLIFQEYVRLDDASQEPGYGIGLSVVRRMVDLLGHTLEVKSRVGHGSQFSVTLPEVEMPDHLVQDKWLKPDLNVHSLTGYLVLFVENDLQLLTSTAEVLSAWGADVRTAASLEEAMAEHESDRIPDLIISDMHLGGRADGLATIEALREKYGRTPESLPAILLTGDLKPALQAEARSLEIRIAYKPVRPSRLRELVAGAVSGQRMTEPSALSRSINQ